MLDIKRTAFSLALTLALAAGIFVTPALAATTEEYCIGEGAVWEGSSGDIGTCFFPPSHEYFTEESCDPAIHDSYYERYNPHIYDWGCKAKPASSSGGNGNSGNDKNGVADRGKKIDNSDPGNTEVNEGNEETTTLTIPGGAGWVTFPAGSCPQKCTVSPSLPGPANSSLPSDALATVYVRVVDEGGAPGNGSYTVCFNNLDNEILTIYRYVSGAWSAIQVANGNPICINASGDGAFYLG